MNIRFIKSHYSGIPEGATHEVDQTFGNRMIAEGFAEEITEATSETIEAIPEATGSEVTEIMTPETPVIAEPVIIEPEATIAPEINAETVNQQA